MITTEEIVSYNRNADKINKLLSIVSLTIPANTKLFTKERKPTKLGFWDSIYRAINALEFDGIVVFENMSNHMYLHCYSKPRISVWVASLSDDLTLNIVQTTEIPLANIDATLSTIKQHYKLLEEARKILHTIPQSLLPLV